MSGPCLSCSDEARERNFELESYKVKAKNKAVETNKPYAVCEDPLQGLFIAEAFYARSEYPQQIRFIASPVQ